MFLNLQTRVVEDEFAPSSENRFRNETERRFDIVNISFFFRKGWMQGEGEVRRWMSCATQSKSKSRDSTCIWNETRETRNEKEIVTRTHTLLHVEGVEWLILCVLWILIWIRCVVNSEFAFASRDTTLYTASWHDMKANVEAEGCCVLWIKLISDLDGIYWRSQSWMEITYGLTPTDDVADEILVRLLCGVITKRLS